MKRDLELIRCILKDMESSEGFWFYKVTPEGYEDEDIINNHLVLMHEAGLIEGNFHESENGHIHSYEVRMTNYGYDYISMAKNDSIWGKLKNKIKEKALDLPIEITKQLLVYYTKEMLNLTN